MAFSYEDWKKKNTAKRKSSNTVVPSFEEFKASRPTSQRETKSNHIPSMEAFRYDEQGPKSEKAKQADADRFARGHKSEVPKSEKAKKADADRFAGNYLNQEAKRVEKVRQTDADRFAKKYTTEQARKNHEELKSKSTISKPTDIPRLSRPEAKPKQTKDEVRKDRMNNGIMNNLNKYYSENPGSTQLSDPDSRVRANRKTGEHVPGVFNAFLEKDNVNDTYSEKVAANLRLGTGDAIESVAGATRWLGSFAINPQNNLIADGIQKLADKTKEGFEDSAFQGNFEPGDWNNPEWLATQLPRAVPQLLTSIIPGIGVAAATGRISKIAKLPKFMKGVVQSIGGAGATATIDSSLEAGGVYEEALRRGMTDDEAKSAANETFLKNFALNSTTTFGEFALALTPAGRQFQKINKIGRIGLRAGGGAVLEGAQEATQEAISADALGDEFNWTDPSTIEAAILGAILGGGVTGGVGAYRELRGSTPGSPTPIVEGDPLSEILTRAVDQMPAELRAEIDASAANFREQQENLSQDESLQMAVDELLEEVPEFQEVVNDAAKSYIEDKKLEQQSSQLNELTQEQQTLEEAQSSPIESPIETPSISPLDGQTPIQEQQNETPIQEVQPLAQNGTQEIQKEQPGPNIQEDVKSAKNPVKVEIGDTVNLEGTRAETEYVVEGIENDSVQVLTPNKVSIKVPKSKILSVFNRQSFEEAEANATPYEGEDFEPSIEALPPGEMVGNTQLPPNFRADVQEILGEFINDEGMTIDEAVNTVKTDEYYADNAEWQKLIDEEAKKHFGYQPKKPVTPKAEPKTESSKTGTKPNKINFTIDQFEPKGKENGLYSLGSNGKGGLIAKVYQSASQEVLDALERAGYRYSKTDTVGPGKGRHFIFVRKNGYQEAKEINHELNKYYFGYRNEKDESKVFDEGDKASFKHIDGNVLTGVVNKTIDYRRAILNELTNSSGASIEGEIGVNFKDLTKLSKEETTKKPENKEEQKKPPVKNEEETHVFIDDMRLKHPKLHKTEELQDIVENLSFDASGFDSKKTFNKYINMLEKEWNTRLDEEEAKPVSESKPPENVKAEPNKYDKMRDRLDFTEKAAAAARKRLAERKGRLLAGLPMDDMIDYSIIGMDKLAHKMVDMAEFSEIMVKEFGETVRNWIPGIYGQSVAMLDYQEEQLDKMLQDAYGDEDMKAVEDEVEAAKEVKQVEEVTSFDHKAIEEEIRKNFKFDPYDSESLYALRNTGIGKYDYRNDAHREQSNRNEETILSLMSDDEVKDYTVWNEIHHSWWSERYKDNRVALKKEFMSHISTSGFGSLHWISGGRASGDRFNKKQYEIIIGHKDNDRIIYPSYNEMWGRYVKLLDAYEGGTSNEVETDSNRPLEESGAGEIQGTKNDGTTGERSRSGKRGNDGSGSNNVPGTRQTESSKELEESTGNGKAPKHDVETSRGNESSSSLRSTGRVNFNITNELDTFGGPKERFKSNIKTLQLVKQLEDEGRKATPEEQKVLARYVGWGGLASAFDNSNKNWTKEFAQLQELVEDGVITQDEYEHARKTTQYAHYTSKDVIQTMYQALENMGVKGGRILEPGMGIGNFFGLLPTNWKADLVGVEFDALTGKIAKQLYQKANVEIKPYQDFKIANGYFDVAIGNPPFSDTTYDYEGNKLTLHNYFFMKSLDKLRPGGILAFVTSAGTMNSKGADARKKMGEKADFLGAIRLPSDAFKGNAGTEVTTDIIFFQKREEGATPNHRGNFVNTLERSVVNRDGNPVNVGENEYFQHNPKMVLGDVTIDKLIARGKPRLGVVSNGNFTEQLAQAIEQLPKDIYQETSNKVKEIDVVEEMTTNLSGLDEGNFAFENGQLVQMSEGRIIKRTDLKGDKIERIKGLVKIRDAAKQALKVQLETDEDSKIKAAIQKLNFLYDGFVKKHKTINSISVQRPNITAMKEDPVGLSLLQSLEREENGVYVKQDIFKERVISFIPTIQNVTTSEEAMMVSFSQKGRIDLPYMSEISNIEQETITKQLGSRIYNNPLSGWEIEDEYLSGNVRRKLTAAKTAAETDPSFQRNVSALEAVIPDDIESDSIAVQFGSPWIPEQDYSDFINSFFQARGDGVRVRFIRQTGDWKIEGKVDTAANTSEHAIASDLPKGQRLTGVEMIELAMNSKTPVLKWKDSFENLQVDAEATSAARLKTQELQDEFQDWLFSDDKREKRLARKYNDEFNSVVLREYDGALVYGGEKESNKSIAGGFNNVKYELRKHQKDVVWRMVQGGNTLLAHVVGAGKTLEMIVGGMEMKRLGLIKKPLYIVPNNLFDQWGRDFRDSYPNANILMLSNDLIPSIGIAKNSVKKPLTSKTDLSKLSKTDRVSIKGNAKKYKVEVDKGAEVVLRDSKGKLVSVKRKDLGILYVQESETSFKSRQNEQRANRGAALNRIAVGNYDAIILTHETFKKLPMSPEYSREFIREQLIDLEFALQAMSEEDNGNNKRTIKQLENAKEKLEEKLEQLIDEDGKDIAIPFEMLGVDQIFVDEAHKFKNLQFHTKLTGITGLSNTASKRSEDLYMKANWLTKMRNGRGVIFATGTPISNTLAEMFTMQRYLQNERLDELNIRHFDMWAKMFGQTEVGVEMDVAGGYKQRTRFKKFKNIPELMTMYKEVTDIKTAPMLNLPRPKNVKFETVVAPLSSQQQAYMNLIVQRANDVSSGAVDKEDDNWLKITGDARKMSLDIRLAEPTADADEESKINIAVENILEIWKDGAETRPDKEGKPLNNLTQLVFADLGTPKAKKQNADGDDMDGDSDAEETLSFDVYNDMREKLVKQGIPREQMVFIHEVKTPKQKEKLFKDVKSGKIRILFGSTEKMGAGMNVQDRLVALHHIDAPWRPSDVEQREGRMIRQGNRLDDVTVYQYVTEGSFDRIMWDLLKNKAGFIEQIMNGDGSVREMEDVGTMELRFAHISAASTGDTTIIDKMKVDSTVRDLRNAKESHRKTIRKRKRTLAQLPERIADVKEELKEVQSDIANIPNKDEGKDSDTFRFEIGGKSYTTRKEAAEALEKSFKKAWDKMANGDKRTFGKVGEFELLFERSVNYISGVQPKVVIKGKRTYSVKYNELSSTGSLTRIENAFDKFQDLANEYQEQIDKFNDELTSLSKTQHAPFKYEKDLEEALKTQTELEKKMLGLNNDANEKVSDDEGGNEDTFFESRDYSSTNEKKPRRPKLKQRAKQEPISTEVASDEDTKAHRQKGYEGSKNDKRFKHFTRKEYSQAPSDTLDRTVNRVQVMKYLMKNFQVKFAYGKTKGKRAVYKNKYAIIRVKDYGDFEALAHEVGHRIDTIIGVSTNQALQNELIQFAEANLEMPKNLPPVQKAKEGVAEYFKQVLYGTQNFEQMAPEERSQYKAFYEVSAELENAIVDGLTEKGWLDNVSELRHLIQSWLDRSPKQEIAGVTARFGDSHKTEESVKRKWLRFYKWALERETVIKAAQKVIEKDVGSKLPDDINAYGMMVGTRGSTARAVQFMEHGTFKTEFVKTNGLFIKTGEPLMDIFEDVDKIGDVDEFGQYLVAKHLYHIKTERGKVKSPITISEETEAYLKEGDEKYGTLAKRMYSFQNRMLEDILGANHMISRELIDKLREEYPYYVPLARIKTETGERDGVVTSGASSGSNYANTQQGIKRMSKYGSTAMIINPMETIMKNVHLMMGIADRNAAGVAMASWADPDSEFATESTGQIIEKIDNDVQVTKVALKNMTDTLLDAGLDVEVMEELDLDKFQNFYTSVFRANDANNEILVWIDGKAQTYKIHDRLVYDAIIDAEAPMLTAILSNPIAKLFTIPVDIVKFGITTTPLFTAQIFVRSFMQLMWKTETTGKSRLKVKHVVKSMKNYRAKNESYQEWMASGAAQSTFISSQQKYLKRSLDGVKLDSKARHFLQHKYKPQSNKERLELMAYISKNVLGYAPKKLQGVNDMLDSALKMAEYEQMKKQTNSKLKAMQASREADMDYMRMGSGVIPRGWNKIDPFFNIAWQGLDAMTRSFVANPKRQGFRGLLLFGIPTFVLALLNYSDDEYWELNSYERDLNWQIPLGNGTFFRLRIPFEVGVVFKTLPEKFMFEIFDLVTGQNKNNWDDFGKNIRNTILPTMVPFVFNLGFKYAFEKDWTNGREFVPMEFQGNSPEKQFNEDTSEIGKWLGGVLDKSPFVIDETIKGLGAAWGNLVLGVSDKTLDATGIVDRPNTKGLRRGYTAKYFSSSINDGSTASLTTFYDKKAELEEAYKDSGVRYDVPPELKAYRQANDDLKDLRKLRKSLTYDKISKGDGSRFTQEEKRAQIDIINNGLRDIARMVQGKDPIDQEELERAWEMVDDYSLYLKAEEKALRKEAKENK